MSRSRGPHVMAMFSGLVPPEQLNSILGVPTTAASRERQAKLDYESGKTANLAKAEAKRLRRAAKIQQQQRNKIQ